MSRRSAALADDLAAELAAPPSIPAESVTGLAWLQLDQLDQLDPNVDNPRGQVGDVTELAQSIAENGGRLLQPIVVVPAETYWADEAQPPLDQAGRWVIIAGHRRHAALTQLGQTHADCLVRTDLLGAAARVAMLVENLQRVDLDALDEANAFDRLKALGLGQREIAQRIGRSQSHVSKRLALLALPDDLREEVHAGTLPLADAAILATLADKPDQLRAAHTLNRRDWYGAKRAVDEVTAAANLADAIAAERTRQSDAGMHVLDAIEGSYWYEGMKTPASLRLDGFPNKPRNHAKKTCHAVYVGGFKAVSVVVTPACTDPGQHLPTPVDPTALTAEKAASKAAAKAWKTDTHVRLDTCKQLVVGWPLKPDKLTALLTSALLASHGHESYRLRGVPGCALDILGHIAPAQETSVRYLPDRLTAEAKHWPALAAAIAIALATGEEQLEHDNDLTPDGRAYLQLLIEAGHQPSDLEQALLDQVPADPA